MLENNVQNNDGITYEAAMARLQEIVTELERGNTPLDKSLEVFEEGVALVKLCNKLLENAEQRVNVLVNEDGNLVQQPFAPLGNS